MLALTPATLRTWEARYRLVCPERSAGGQRLYSRDQVEQLRYVKTQLDAGRRPAEAHRLLHERLSGGESLAAGARLRVLLAESRLGAAHVLAELLGSEAFEVLLVEDAESASRACDELAPSLVVIDTDDAGFDELSNRLRAEGTRVLPIELLERPLSLLGEAKSLHVS
jgi:DNA-binding transcriptional MerR regulator